MGVNPDTNEKQHVALTTQAFFSRQLEFWRIWKEEGRAAALEFAAHDRATTDSLGIGGPPNMVVPRVPVVPAHHEDALHPLATGATGSSTRCTRGRARHGHGFVEQAECLLPVSRW